MEQGQINFSDETEAIKANDEQNVHTEAEKLADDKSSTEQIVVENNQSDIVKEVKPEVPSEGEKLYYTIGEVAKMFDVNTSHIRFWEKEFDIIKPKKNKKGNRLFTKKDVENFHLIYHLVKERGFTLQGAKAKLKENRQDVTNNHEVIKTLQNIKQFLLEIKKGL